MNYLRQAIDHALPAGSEHFDLFSVPLHVSFREMQDAMLAGQFTLAAPLHAVCEAISHYSCDILLITGRRAVCPAFRP